MALTWLACATTSRPPVGIRSSLTAIWRIRVEPCGFLQQRVGLFVFAHKVRTRDRQRQQAAQAIGVVDAAGDGQALVEPLRHCIRLARLPRGLGRQHQRARQALLIGFLFEDAAGGGGFAARALEIARHPRGPGQQQARVPFQHARAFPVRIQESQRGRCGSRGVLDAEGLQRCPGQAQRMLDGLVRDVALEVVLRRAAAARARGVPAWRASSSSAHRRWSDRRLRGESPA